MKSTTTQMPDISISNLGVFSNLNILGPQKICSFDCVYCNLGPSMVRLGQIKSLELPNIADISKTVSSIFLGKQTLHQSDRSWAGIAISGNGEPTLHPMFTSIIDGIMDIRSMMVPKAKIVVMTNGDRLDSRAITESLNRLDERFVRVDVFNDKAFREINRSLSRSHLEKVIQGAQELRDCYVQAAVLDRPGGLKKETLDEWLEVVGLIRPKGVFLHAAEPGMDEQVLHLAHLIERKADFKVLVLNSENAG